jgi:hypothetical protein
LLNCPYAENLAGLDIQPIDRFGWGFSNDFQLGVVIAVAHPKHGNRRILLREGDKIELSKGRLPDLAPLLFVGWIGFPRFAKLDIELMATALGERRMQEIELALLGRETFYWKRRVEFMARKMPLIAACRSATIDTIFGRYKRTRESCP